MKRLVFLVLMAMLVTGCGVSRMKVQNWNPGNDLRGSTFYECLQQAQQVESTAGFVANQNGATGGARTGAKTNQDMLVACMNAKGYQLRRMTGGEVVSTIITSPLAVTFTILGADVDNFY